MRATRAPFARASSALLLGALAIGALAIGALAAGCCGGEGGGGEDPAPVAPVGPGGAAAEQPSALPVLLELRDRNGQLAARLTPREGGGYRIEDAQGERTGSLRVTTDRVSVKDAAGNRIGKVSLRDDGFKLVSADDVTQLKIQRRGGVYRLKTADERVIGERSGARIEQDGRALVEARREGEEVLVMREGELLLRVRGEGLSPEAAVWLGLTEYPLPIRLGLLVFDREVRHP